MPFQYTEEYRNLFDFNENLSSITNTIFDKKHHFSGLKEILASFSVGKAYKTHKAILLLCRHGYGEDAAILLRSLFDLDVTLTYILNDKTDERINRYFSHDWVARKKMYDYIVDKPDLLGEMENKSQEYDSIGEVLKQAKIAEDKYRYNIFGWSDKSIKRMAEEIGRKNEYRTIYFLQSNIIHSTTRSINEYMKVEGDGLTVMAGESTNWIENDLVGGLDFFFRIINTCNNLLKLEIDDQLQAISGRFVKAVEEKKDEKKK